LATLDQHANAWVQDRTSAPVPVFGRDECSEIDAEPPVSPEPSTTFVRDVRELSPVLEQIVAADTFASLRTIAENEGTGNVRYDDEAWVATVYDFVAAHHHGVMDRSHIVQALMPLYLGRAASFIGQHANSPVGDTEQHLERLSQAFERHRQYLIEHWHNKT
jgi:hypothetical protein